MIIDALDKAQRDEIVKIPKQVVGAESTRKHLTAGKGFLLLNLIIFEQLDF